MALTPKQQRFAVEYTVDFNATAAAGRAGYSKKTAAQQGHNLLQMPEIQAAIKEECAKRRERTEITGDMVIGELAKIAFANGADYARVVGRTVKATKTDDLTKDQKAAISCIEKTKFGIKVSTYDKVKALELLSKYLCLFDNNGGGKDGGVTIVDDI